MRSTQLSETSKKYKKRGGKILSSPTKTRRNHSYQHSFNRNSFRIQKKNNTNQSGLIYKKYSVKSKGCTERSIWSATKTKGKISKSCLITTMFMAWSISRNKYSFLFCRGIGLPQVLSKASAAVKRTAKKIAGRYRLLIRW